MASGDNPPPLSQIIVPQPSGGDIADPAAAVRLGKALFWDIQVGGDGQVACATCHFRAGADNRRINTIDPGPNNVFESGGVTGPGQTFNGASINATDDRVGSQGIVGSTFVSVDPNPANAADSCSPNQIAPFFASRRVTGRNAPTVIGAIFFRDNFWDGRANNRFNGKNPFGFTGNDTEGSFVSITNASLASQSVGPPTNDIEMSCTGRAFNGAGSLAEKMLARVPLGKQVVSPTDGVLGAMSNSPSPGINKTYTQLIQDAFGVSLAGNSLAQFSRFWGQAVQAYETTLIPSATPFDAFLSGNSSAMTQQQQRGWDRFQGKGHCTKCHSGSELSDATVGFAASNGLINEDGGDQGFHNNGVRPTAEDLGRAGLGPGGVSFSVSGSSRDRGAFKTSALRNVKLTAPYFHNGAFATLEEVVDFYSRGGDFNNPEKASRMQRISFDSGDKAAVVDFLRNALTDCRVEKERAPFDHPSLPLPNGTAVPAIGANGTGACPP
ncbi:cytochrome-c peroxidase [Pendulispora albinea]|uniref:Cytochrome c domain-containing protein n=1 Tax=Pendulispora albinea TaxID=2741071 RepID=A0ABZ2LV73_9BACT